MFSAPKGSLPFAILASFVLACAPRAGVRAIGATKVDDFGDTLVFGAPPARIASLDPTTTEILFAVGAGRRLVGRTHFDLWPDSARLVPDLGDGIRPNVEAVLAAKPDLVFVYASESNRPAATRLRAAGIRVVAFRIDKIEDFRRLTPVLGRLVGDSLRGVTTADSVEATLQRVIRSTAQLPHPTVFFEMNERPVITIGGDSFLSELTAIAGARNIYASLPAASPTVSMEDVVRRDPDYVLTTPAAVASLRANTVWQAIRAVREGHILGYDTNLVTRAGPRLGEAAVSLAHLLHPAGVPGLEH